MHGKYLFIKSICYTGFNFLKLISFKTLSKPHKTRSHAIKKREVVWVALHFNTVTEITQFQKCRKNIVKSLMRIAVTLWLSPLKQISINLLTSIFSSNSCKNSPSAADAVREVELLAHIMACDSSTIRLCRSMSILKQNIQTINKPTKGNFHFEIMDQSKSVWKGGLQ